MDGPGTPPLIWRCENHIFFNLVQHARTAGRSTVVGLFGGTDTSPDSSYVDDPGRMVSWCP